MSDSGAVSASVQTSQSEAVHVMPSTLRTLQIGDDWIDDRAGGLQRYYSELLAHLPETGTEYTGLVAGSETVAQTTHGKVIGFAPPSAPLLKRLIACRLAGQKIGPFDLIVTHFALYGLPWLDRLRSAPSVGHFHGPWAGESGIDGANRPNVALKTAIESQVYQRARRLIVLSQSFRDELVRRFHIDEDLIQIVPGGIDTRRFNTVLSRTAAREKLGWPQDRFIVLSVRRQVPRMGLENLIDAARRVVAEAPDALFLIGGSGPLGPELAKRVREHGLEEHVRLLGRIPDDDLPAAYRAADMSLVPSQALEGFGLITLESLASGTPVVVTPVGGLPETVGPFAPQCVLADSSTEEMAAVLVAIVRGERRLPDSASCREYAVEGFSWPRIARRIRAVYDEART